MEPCPFCGHTKPSLLVGEYDVFCLSCPNCGAKGPEADSKEEAKELWNDRNE